MSIVIEPTWLFLPPHHICLTGLIDTRCPFAKTQLVGLVHWTAQTALVQQRLSPPVNLYDLGTQSCLQTALGPRGSMTGHWVDLSFSWLKQRAYRFPYIPITATVGIWLLWSWHENLHFSHAGVAHPRLSKVCPSTDHACCFHIAERGGAHGPWRRCASGSWECHLFILGANQLRITSNRHSMTVWNTVHSSSRRVFSFTTTWANTLKGCVFNPNTLLKCELVQHVHTQMHFHQCEQRNVGRNKSRFRQIYHFQGSITKTWETRGIFNITQVVNCTLPFLQIVQ